MNNTILLPEIIEPLAQAINPVLATVSWLLGGVVGITIIFLFLRWVQMQRMIMLLEDIRYDLDQQNKKKKIKTHKDRPTVLRMVRWLYESKRRK